MRAEPRERRPYDVALLQPLRVLQLLVLQPLRVVRRLQLPLWLGWVRLLVVASYVRAAWGARPHGRAPLDRRYRSDVTRDFDPGHPAGEHGCHLSGTAQT